MIELSAQDYAAILAAIEPYKFDSGSQVNEMLDGRPLAADASLTALPPSASCNCWM